MRTFDLAGQRFGRLVVIERDMNSKDNHNAYWMCKCDCGNRKSVATSHLTHGTVTSCGCLRKEQAIERFKAAAKNNVKHGGSYTRLYSVWHVMLERCEKEKYPTFKYYGAKGIKVCSEWHDFGTFAKWAFENGYAELNDCKHGDKLSIDRIDSKGNYCPENCRWITARENHVRALKERQERIHANRSTGTGCAF